MCYDSFLYGFLQCYLSSNSPPPCSHLQFNCKSPQNLKHLTAFNHFAAISFMVYQLFRNSYEQFKFWIFLLLIWPFPNFFAHSWWPSQTGCWAFSFPFLLSMFLCTSFRHHSSAFILNVWMLLCKNCCWHQYCDLFREINIPF